MRMKKRNYYYYEVLLFLTSSTLVLNVYEVNALLEQSGLTDDHSTYRSSSKLNKKTLFEKRNEFCRNDFPVCFVHSVFLLNSNSNSNCR